ncbi:MAG TPA: PQQ-binding-like beta-propeller repeat protein, partial [Candidatus Polarisedimenticolia bacterium]|nr:PQQ-binding-like beta-propeller repeat protein [Candidatus Polarisedimenticolia bacterium]
FVAAFRLSDGVEIWRTKREDVPTWSTPAVLPRGDSTQVVVNGLKRIGGYDTATGSALWWMRGGGDIPVPTPVAAHGLIFITNAHGGPSPIYAIRADASGEIAEDKAHPSRAQIAWSVDRGGAYMQTPLVYSDHLYVCRDNGILTVFEARTGKELHQTRLGTGSTGFTASAVAGDGKLYYTAESGEVYVLAAGAAPSVLSTNDLGETAMATPAIADGVIYFRTRSHLVAVGAAAEGQTRPAR